MLAIETKPKDCSIMFMNKSYFGACSQIMARSKRPFEDFLMIEDLFFAMENLSRKI